MSPKLLQRLATALVVLVLLWLSLTFLRGRQRDDDGRLRLPVLSERGTARIRLASAADSIVISRQAGGWQVNGMPASSRAVQEFLAAASDSTATSEVAAQSPASHARLGVDTVAGRRLTVADSAGATLLDLVVGNRGPEFNGYYVRRAGAPEVYLLRGSFAELLARGENDWRDRQVADLKPDAVARIEVRLGPGGWTLARAGSGWTIGTAAADSTRVARLLAQLGDLRAVGFPDRVELDSIDFGHPERSLTVLNAAGDSLLALVLDSTTSGAFWVRSAGGAVYRMDGRTTGLVTPAESTLVAHPK